MNYIQAKNNHSLRQEYLERLVRSSGKKFPDVSEFRYISHTEALKIKEKLVHQSEKELENITAVCSPNGEIGNGQSTIYFTENNFSPTMDVLLYSASIPQEDISLVQAVELTDHEAVHAEHYAHGIPGFSLSEFQLNTGPGAVLFMVASEIDAHTKHIQALGHMKPRSRWPQDYQKGLVKFFTGYMQALPKIADAHPALEPLAKRVHSRYRELRYNAL